MAGTSVIQKVRVKGNLGDPIKGESRGSESLHALPVKKRRFWKGSEDEKRAVYIFKYCPHVKFADGNMYEVI